MIFLKKEELLTEFLKYFTTYCQKFAPQIEEFESIFEHDVPVSDRHVKIQPFLALIFGVVEGEVVEVLEFVNFIQIEFELRKLLFEFV